MDIRCRNELYARNCVQNVNRFGGGSVMVGEGIHHRGRCTDGHQMSKRALCYRLRAKPSTVLVVVVLRWGEGIHHRGRCTDGHQISKRASCLSICER